VKGRLGSAGLALVGLGLALLPSRATWGAGFSYKEVARLGAKAPGGGTLVNDFEPGAISGTGEVAFVVDYDYGGNAGNNSEGLYLASNGTLIPIAEPAHPAVAGWTFIDNGPIGMLLSPVGMNANGDISFGSDVEKTGTTDVRSGNFLWIRKTATLVALNLPDQDAPGGGTFDNTKGGNWTGVNDQGDAVFSPQVTDAQGNMGEGVFARTADGMVHDIARPGDKLADGSVLTRARRPTINNAGAVVFEGETDKLGAAGIYLSVKGQITAVATPNTKVPGGSDTFMAVQAPRLNNQGQVIFLGQTAAGWGLYESANNQLTPLVQPGLALKDGVTLDQLSTEYGSTALTASGDIAMLLKLGNSAGDGVYLMRGMELAVVARDGMDLPGVGMLDTAKGQYVGINSAGQVAFQANFKDGHVGLVLATPVP
jgi:hypothetical protein